MQTSALGDHQESETHTLDASDKVLHKYETIKQDTMDEDGEYAEVRRFSSHKEQKKEDPVYVNVALGKMDCKRNGQEP